MVKVLHVMCDLSPGGAERLVLALAERTPGAEVATVQSGGALTASVHDMGRRRRWPGLVPLARLARLAGRFDLVHTHLWAGHTWGLLAGRLAGVPRVATVHNLDRDESPGRRWVRDHVHRRLGHTVAVSEAVRAGLRRRGFRASCIPNGIAPRPQPHVGGGGILCVGRLVPQKGFDVLLRAAGERPVVVAGAGPDAERLRALAGSNVRFVGHVDPWPLYARADVVVIPSRWEGFGLVAVEAMAAGVPVVASRVDALPEVLGDAGELVPPEDVGALAAALERLDDAAHREALARRGRMRARGFHIDHTAAAYQSLYDRLLSRG